jgi:hypothetical protein
MEWDKPKSKAGGAGDELAENFKHAVGDGKHREKGEADEGAVETADGGDIGVEPGGITCRICFEEE